MAKIHLACSGVVAGHMNQVQLAARLGSDARQVRRLLDFIIISRLDQLESALGAFGKRLVVDVVEAEAA